VTIAVALHDPEGKPAVRFAPARDIKPYELALIMNLFVKMAVSGKEQDWRSYLAEHKLERHFEAAGS
jgi:hypothetical protein